MYFKGPELNFRLFKNQNQETNMKKILAFILVCSTFFLQANRQALINAALKGSNDNLLTNIAYLNEQDQYGDTPLMTLVKMKSSQQYDDDQIINAISLLIRSKANIETSNNDGSNPLLKVVTHESYRNNIILEKLLYKNFFGLLSLKNDINVDIKDKDGNTALIRAARAGNNFAVNKLLKFGADINATNHQGYTALGIAHKEKHKGVYALLTSFGAVIKRQDPSIKEHPFIQAAHEGELAIMQQLLQDNKAIIDMQDHNGRTALFIATQNGNVDAVQFLLEQGAHPNIKNEKANTPLLQAANLPLDKNAIKIIELLLAYDADPTAVDKYENSAYDRATDPKIKAILKKVCPA